jgi:anti-anti-sigma factor
MSFQHTVTEIQGLPVHTVRGRVDSASAGEMEKSLASAFNAPGQRAVLDLAGLDYISSAGLRVVLMLAKRAKQTGGRLLLCGLSASVREVFEISGFLKIIEVVKDVTAASAALG